MLNSILSYLSPFLKWKQKMNFNIGFKLWGGRETEGIRRQNEEEVGCEIKGRVVERVSMCENERVMKIDTFLHLFRTNLNHPVLFFT